MDKKEETIIPEKEKRTSKKYKIVLITATSIIYENNDVFLFVPKDGYEHLKIGEYINL